VPNDGQGVPGCEQPGLAGGAAEGRLATPTSTTPGRSLPRARSERTGHRSC